MHDKVGLALTARNPDGSIAASRWLPGPWTEREAENAAARFAEETGLSVEISARGGQGEPFPTYIGRRLPETQSRLISSGLSGEVSRPMAETVRPLTRLPFQSRG